MKITVLDSATLGDDIDLSPLNKLGEVEIFYRTNPDLVVKRTSDSEVVIINKIVFNRENLELLPKLKLICIAATGYDNVDIDCCREFGIIVCNVRGYSSDSVAQTTLATILELATHIRQFSKYVSDGSYTHSGVSNCLVPVYHEICGKTWGIIGLGNIGAKVATIATAMGCNILAFKRTPSPDYTCVDLPTLFSQSDIISIHLPLTAETTEIVSRDLIFSMKKDAILYNSSRGKTIDEKAVADAVLSGKIAAFGSDVFSVEPMSETNPLNLIKHLDNVCLTPHMAWGSFEARNRCLQQIICNVAAFQSGKPINTL